MCRANPHGRHPASLSRLALMLALVAGAIEAAEAPIARAVDLRSLSSEQAMQGLPATLRGTVTFIEPSLVFLQDETAGTYFRPGNPGDLRVGDDVEVTGRTHLGIYLPGLDRATFRVLRHGTLPAPVEASLEDLAAGRYHYQRVAVEGIVRSLTALGEGRSLVRLALSSRVLDVWVEASPPTVGLLVDSRVRVTGLAVGTINSRRQLIQPYLRTLEWKDIAIVQPALPEAEVPRIAPKDLLTFGVAGPGGNRVRVGGTVLTMFPRGMLYLRSDKTALGVRLATPVAVDVGDQVEVLGFTELNRFSASLVDAQLVSRQAGPPPEPVRVHIGELFRGTFDSELVSVTAVVTDSYRAERERTLVLQEDDWRVRVSLLDPATEVPVGSRVQVTGISRIILSEGVGYSAQPESISIYLRSPADFLLLSSPSWWTVGRLSVFLAVLGGAILLAGLWIALLRRQVRRQAEAARRQIQSEAAWEERQRLAREFHDTLEQELVGLGLRLDAVATRDLDEKGRTLVAASRRLVSRIQAETRNLVSDLRHPSGNAVDLASALGGMAELKSPDGRTEVRIEVASALPLLPVGAVHNLRMIARESVTNALKHSGATRITVRLAVVDDARIVMSITDNGRGFDVTKETLGKSGHFGCVGMRERGTKIGATVAWHSMPGEGATVTVTMPLAARVAAEEPALATASAGGAFER